MEDASEALSCAAAANTNNSIDDSGDDVVVRSADVIVIAGWTTGLGLRGPAGRVARAAMPEFPMDGHIATGARRSSAERSAQHSPAGLGDNGASARRRDESMAALHSCAADAGGASGNSGGMRARA